jgi:hypothetical protein
MKFAALALVLLASLFASLTHGMAAAPACVEMVAVESQADADSGDASGSDGNGASIDDAHCGFGMTASRGPHVTAREYIIARIGGQSADLLLGRVRVPDQRPPDVTRI